MNEPRRVAIGLRDRDTKFSGAFDAYFARKDGGVVRAPYRSPIANSFAESWIGSLKREALNHFFCFSLRQLDHIVQAYAEYHSEFRPHQRRGNRPLGVDEDPPPKVELRVGDVRCRCWLGGILTHYYRGAA